MTEPIKKLMNAIITVICKSLVTELMAKAKNKENTTKTIRGENISSFNILLLLRNDKKFSPGYNPLKKLFTHSSSMNPRILNIIVNNNESFNTFVIFPQKYFVIEYKALIFSHIAF